MIVIESDSPLRIDYSATGTAAILQNAQFLLATVISSCPLHREFGWDPPVDDGSEFAKATISAQVIEKIERNIPELTVKSVEFIFNQEKGNLVARAEVEMRE